MTAPPPTKNVANCQKKRRYSDEFAARAGAQYFCVVRAVARVWVYPCPCCRGWHFTRKPKARKYLVTEQQLLTTEAPCEPQTCLQSLSHRENGRRN